MTDSEKKERIAEILCKLSWFSEEKDLSTYKHDDVAAEARKDSELVAELLIEAWEVLSS